MANHKSAIKAHRQNIKANAQNREYRSRLRRALKETRAVIESGDSPKASTELKNTVSLIDTLAGKGIIHTNAAARHKSRLSRKLAAVSSA